MHDDIVVWYTEHMHTQSILVCQYVFEFHSLVSADWSCAEGGVVVVVVKKSGLENPSRTELHYQALTFLNVKCAMECSRSEWCERE